nr:reverse transcriptase domain-containing protein [Tanacetum cinerariifolium]
MSQPTNQAHTPANFAVRNTAGKGSKQTPDSISGCLPADKLREICEKHYNQILSSMAKKVHQEKLQGIQTRLTYGESLHRNSQTQFSESYSCDRKKRPKKRRQSPVTASRATKIERWAMSTWCHMFNSTLIGSARVWFDKLPPESIDNYEMLWKAFLGNYSQQKKYIKDLVEIHHIKQKEGESTEAFMERFKAKSMHVSGAPECMRISGFMHDITNPDIITKLNDNIPKSVDEMMSVTTSFLRGEVAVANQSKKKAPPAWKHHVIGHRPNFDKRLDLKSPHKSSRMQDRFTPLTKTPREILAMDTIKFKAPPPMTEPAENQNKNKFCEFHGDKGHSTDECIHLRRKIEEAVKSGQMSLLVKEIKQGGKQGEQSKATKKGKLPKKKRIWQFLWSSPGNE